MASDGGCSFHSGFPNCHVSQTSRAYNTSARTVQKTSLLDVPLLRSCLLSEPIIVVSNCCRGVAAFENVGGTVTSRSLISNGSTFQNIFQ
jgi:hypothetical protein